MLTVIQRALNRATFHHMKGTNFIRSHSIAAWLRSINSILRTGRRGRPLHAKVSASVLGAMIPPWLSRAICHHHRGCLARSCHPRVSGQDLGRGRISRAAALALAHRAVGYITGIIDLLAVLPFWFAFAVPANLRVLWCCGSCGLEETAFQSRAVSFPFAPALSLSDASGKY